MLSSSPVYRDLRAPPPPPPPPGVPVDQPRPQGFSYFLKGRG